MTDSGDARRQLLEVCDAHYMRALDTADPYGDRKLLRRALVSARAEIERIDASLDAAAFLRAARQAVDGLIERFLADDSADPDHWRPGAMRTLSNEIERIARSFE